MARYEHEWTDVSRHGSPSYICRYCDVWQWDVKKGEESTHCPKAKEALRRQARNKVEEEKRDYRRLKKERDYFDYLEAKYAE